MTAENRSAAITPLELQPAQEPPEAEFYQLDDLVRYHDRTFINYAYAALARRAPTPEELAVSLDDLRSGRRDKVDIIEGLLNVPDRKPAVRIAGLRGQALRRASRWPIVGYAWRLLRGLASLPLQVKHQQRFEAYAIGQQQKIADHVNGVIAPALADSIDAVLMLAESLQEHVVSLEEALRSQQAKMADQRNEIEANINEEQHQLEAKFSAQQAELQAVIQDQQNAQRQEFDDRLNAQQGLIVQEQRVIVETQKVVMEELRSEIRALAAAYDQRSIELLAELRRLQASVEAAQSTEQPFERK